MKDLISSDEAQAIWQDFEARYQALYAEYVQKKPQLVLTERHSFAEITPEKQQAAQKILSWWRQKVQLDTKLPIHFNPNLSDQFNHLVALSSQKTNASLLFSLNTHKKQRLFAALHANDWTDEIFHDPDLPLIAMALYRQGQWQNNSSHTHISYQQLCTILERHQVFEYYQHKGTFNVLDESCQLSPKAKHYLLSIKHHFLKALSDVQWQNFCIMVSALPKSEQIFYLASCDAPSGLGERLHFLDALPHDAKDGCYIICSTGVREAMCLVRFGVAQYARPLVQLDNHKPSDIERGVRHQSRLTTLKYPGHQLPSTIHNWSKVNSLEITAHDYYHSHVFSLLPLQHKKAFLRMVDVLRQASGHQWSKELWEWVDNDFLYYFKRLGQQPAVSELNESSEQFICFLSEGRLIGELDEYLNSFLLDLHGYLTVAGMVIFLDMIEQKDVWKNDFLIDPNYISQQDNAIGSALSFVEDFHGRYLKNEQDLMLKLFKLQFGLGDGKNYEIFNQAIESNRDEISQKLSLQKNKKIGVLGKNCLYLAYEGKVITNQVSKDLLFKYLEGQYPQVEPQQLHRCVELVLTRQYSKKELETYIRYMQQGLEPAQASFNTQPNWSDFRELHDTWFWLAFLLPVLGHLIMYVCYCLQAQEATANLSMSALSESLIRP